MIDKKKLKELLNELKLGLEKIYGSKLIGVYLYGSYARGSQNEDSDVDILVVLNEMTYIGQEIDKTGNLTSTVSLKYDVTVTRAFATESDWKTGDTSFLSNVRDDAKAA